jgi:hypothetical protein
MNNLVYRVILVVLCLSAIVSCTEETPRDRICSMTYFGFFCIDVLRTPERAKMNITEIFTETLGRSPTESELAYYVNLTIKQKKSYETVRLELSRSDEAKNLIKNMFREIVGKEATPENLEYYRNLLEDNHYNLSKIRTRVVKIKEQIDQRKKVIKSPQ